MVVQDDVNHCTIFLSAFVLVILTSVIDENDATTFLSENGTSVIRCRQTNSWRSASKTARLELASHIAVPTITAPVQRIVLPDESISAVAKSGPKKITVPNRPAAIANGLVLATVISRDWLRNQFGACC